MQNTALSGVIGLSRLKQQISRSVVSSRIRHASMGHTLICGAGGCGKSLLARTIAKMLELPFYHIEAAELQSRRIVLDWILKCNGLSGSKSFVLFLDECHRLSVDRQEAFYYPMIERTLEQNGQKIKLNPFTLIGATTRKDMLDQGSFVTRFQNVWDIGRYGFFDILQIIDKAMVREGLVCEVRERCAIASRCLGIPRTAVNLVMKVRDEVLYRHPKDNRVLLRDVLGVFNLEEIDNIGLEKVHLTYLRALAQTPAQPKGLGVLSAMLGRAKPTIEDTVEPILFSLHYVVATPRGRMVTDKGLLHLKGTEVAQKGE